MIRSVVFIQDVDQTIGVMRSAGQWLKDSGKNPNEYWHIDNLNKEYLSKHAEPKDFYVGLVDGIPAIGCLLQDNERNQSWEYIDGKSKKKALYIHWLCIDRKFSGMNLPKEMVHFALQQAKHRKIQLVRLDTEASKAKLRKIYEDLGFMLMGIDQKQNTAFYQIIVSQ